MISCVSVLSLFSALTTDIFLVFLFGSFTGKLSPRSFIIFICSSYFISSSVRHSEVRVSRCFALLLFYSWSFGSDGAGCWKCKKSELNRWLLDGGENALKSVNYKLGTVSGDFYLIISLGTGLPLVLLDWNTSPVCLYTWYHSLSLESES